MVYKLEDLALAYRAAKADLYYESNSRILDIVNYEANLNENLSSLHERLSAGRGSLLTTEYLGTWTVLAKSLDEPESAPQTGQWMSIDADPSERWWLEAKKRKSDNDPILANFRLMAKCGIDMHIVSTLWMQKVGSVLDQSLSASSRGGRLRPPNAASRDLRVGSFGSYLPRYRGWRDGAVSHARSALESGVSPIVITADASNFYHRLNANFLDPSNREFYSRVLNVNLTAGQARLTDVLVSSLNSWSELVSRDVGVESAGLPVGLPASALIGNLALAGLDKVFIEKIKANHYGRYIDDLLIVVNDSSGLESREEVYGWLCERSDGRLKGLKSNDGKIEGFVFDPEYLAGARIEFANDKNRVLKLQGEAGKYLLARLELEVKERNSEWRSLPELPDDPLEVGASIAYVSAKDGTAADSFAKVESVVSRRASFAICLRTYETYARELPPREWKNVRDVFFKSIAKFVVDMPNIFTFSDSIGRLVMLAASCSDFESVSRVVEYTAGAVMDCVESSKMGFAGLEGSGQELETDIASVWAGELLCGIIEALCAGVPRSVDEADISASQLVHYANRLTELCGDSTFASLPRGCLVLGRMSDRSIAEFINQQRGDIFWRDLGRVPARFSYLPDEIVPIGYSATLKGFLDDLKLTPPETKVWVDGKQFDAVRWISQGGDFGALRSGATRRSMTRVIDGRYLSMILPTRPPSVKEAFVLTGDICAQSKNFAGDDVALYSKVVSRLMAGLRGFHLDASGVSVSDCGGQDRRSGSGHSHVMLTPSKPVSDPVVAVTMKESEQDSFLLSAAGNEVLTMNHYVAIMRLLNAVLKSNPRPKYVILGESSIPSKWFMYIARVLSASGICLIAGVEPIAVGSGSYRNQVWAALDVKFGDLPSTVVYRQDKMLASHHEEQLTRECLNRELDPQVSWSLPPVICHGNFWFGILVCSEMTNIAHRASLRGCVDGVIVPEFNPDTKTFSAIVEAAANDMHCYVIQVNSRNFGDSRVRAPMKKDYLRDVVRLQGGADNYFAVARLKVSDLRKFQSMHRLHSSVLGKDPIFKPAPDGFEPHRNRRAF